MLLKRIFCLFLSCLLGLGAGALAEETESQPFIMAGFDDTQYREWGNNQFFLRMEEITGVKFSYQQYTDEKAWTAAKASMTAGGAMPDALFKANLSSAECIDMREKGVLVDLKPYLEENCPNLWALLQANPEYLAAMTLPDGSVAALPYITSIPMQNYMWINSAWLKALKLSTPTNAEELAAVLAAFKTRDPNKNGKQDEIPLGFLGAFDLKFLGHAFGLIANDYNVFARDGQVKFMPLEENFRLFVTWCRDLYAQGLLDRSGFSTSNALRQVTDSKAVATYGMILTPVAADIFRVSWSSDYVLLDPLTYDGRQTYRDFSGNVLRGTFAVTTACKEPEKLLQWVDYLYGEQGAILASVGKENVDYLVDGDGTWRLTEAVQSNTYFSSATLIDGGATSPGTLAADFQRRYGANAELRTTLERQEAINALTTRPFPYYSLTRAQQDEITPLQNQIGYYVDMQIARWVLGEEEISDASFSAFERTLDEMGLPTFLAFWQNVLENL